MSDMKLITKMKPVKYIIIDSNPYRLGKVLEILDELEECDGIFATIVIHDDSLKQSLEQRGVINTNARGGSYRGSRYQAFVKELESVIDASQESGEHGE